MRALYISYFYPPLGGPAALRAVKTVKYLSRSGIACDVITVKDLEYVYWDESLLAECAEDRIFRTRSLDPMALTPKTGSRKSGKASKLYMNTPEKMKLLVRRAYPIDNKIGWVPFLLQAGREALAETAYDLIYVSLGPFSSALGAYQLSRESGIPLVLDLRDYWNLLSDYKLQATPLHRKFSLYWEEKVYRHASLIVTATKGIGEDAARHFGEELAKKMLTVYNGWDEEDFQDLPALQKQKGFTFAYFGAIYARRTLKHFYAALKRLREENSLPENTRVWLVGNFFREANEEIKNSGISDIIEIIPQLEHNAALANMQAADALLLVINSSSPRGTLTSKIFEYLRVQKPILAMVPRHKEAAGLLRGQGHDLICAMESADSIYNCLKRLFAQGKKEYLIPWELERSKQISLLAERLRSLIQNS
ncbi:MAG: glycosyltransferase [Candidatus Syntrophosphaera sp.]